MSRYESIVRNNLMSEFGYTPYCGNNIPRDKEGGCDNPRTRFIGYKRQFVCPKCGWTSSFEKEFIVKYIDKWSNHFNNNNINNTQ